MYWIIFLERLKQFPATGQHIFQNAWMKMEIATNVQPMIRHTPLLNWEGGVIANFNSSWTVRVRRDDLLTLQVDGTKGSAVAGLRDCYIQHYGNTPKPVWNPDIKQPIDFYEDWSLVPKQEDYDNAFKVQWELFLKHIVKDEPFPWSILEGAKGVQLAEKGLESWAKRAWVDIHGIIIIHSESFLYESEKISLGYRR